MKGFGIILVVIAHAGFPHEQYIKLFHMSIFFLISGFCHRETYSENIRSVAVFFGKRLKSLYVPYVLSNFVLLCFHNVFYHWNFYTDNPLFLQADMVASGYGLIGAYTVPDFLFQLLLTIGFVGGEQLSGTLWFLRALFEVEIFYVGMDWIGRRFGSNRKYFHCFVTAVVVLSAYFLNTRGIHIVTGIEVSCYYYVFFVIGILLQKIKLQRTFPVKLMLPVSVVWLLINGLLVTYSLIHNMNFPPFYIMNGIMGGGFLKSLADLSKMCRTERLFEYIGRHSMSIMLWHFLSYKIISFGYSRLCGLPDYYVASFPFLKVPHLWIAYTIVGVALPLMADWVVDRVRRERKSVDK